MSATLTFNYKATDPLGNTYEGEVDAVNLADARQQLSQDGFHVVDIAEADDLQLNLFGRGVSRNDIIYVTNQLAIMLETGINLASALGNIVEDETNPRLKELLSELKHSVETGEDFSTALAKHPKHFDATYVSLVRASEMTGSLGAALERIAQMLRKDLETRSKVRSALAYPCVMMVLAVSVTIFLLVYVLPKFEPLFQRRGVDLPTPTIVMMAVSNSLLTYWYLWIVGVVGLIAGFLYGKRTEIGREIWDGVRIKTPILGPMFRKVIISRSIHTLASMIASGVSVLKALELSAEVSGNVHYRKLWEKVLSDVTGGKQIHESLSGNPLVPTMLTQMIRSGEETGKLDLVLERVGTYYDREVETALKTATSLIEPLMITAMGLVVGGIGMSLLLPIFTLGRPAG